ncbi:MAG: alpha-2-macroglobulin family protein [Bacteroidales bacterium]|nr:alpha-2-macroglobulin family protein [Bacteroidales bacterium]
MKRTFFSILIILLTTTLMFGLTSNDNFAMMWETAQSYEKKSQPESALAIVNKICKKAEKEQNEGQIIKCLIYKLRLNNEKYDNKKTPELIAEIEKLISDGKMSESGNALLHLIAADLYQNFKSQHNLNSRTDLADYIPEDINEWSENLFDQKTEEHQNAALSISEATRRTDIKLFADALVLGESSRELRPTLFDFICWHIIETRNVKYEDQKLKSLAPTEVFMTSDLQKHKALTLFQQLLKYHHDDRTLTLYCESERLRYGYENLINDELSSTENAKWIYLERLAELEEKYADLDFSCEVALARANQYMNQYSYFEKDERFGTTPIENPYYEKAYEICQNAIQKHPNYKRINALKNLQETLKMPLLNVSTNHIQYPGKDFEMKISHKNVKNAILKIYKIDNDAISYNEKKNKSSKDCVSDKSQPAGKYEINFADDEMFRQHDTILTLSLDCGIYEFVIAETEAKTNTNMAGTIFVTKYEMLKRNSGNENEYFVLDRLTGEPQSGVKTMRYTWNNGAQQQKDESVTDNDGRVVFGFNPKNGRYSVFLSKDNDKSYPENSTYNYYYPGDTLQKEKTVTEIFTDRGIYRPCQKVYFKTIVYNATENAAKVVPNQTCEVTLNDANGKNLGTLTLQTNEYGSASGTFTLPTDVLSGRFNLRCNNETHYFSVEEYKRPKFEINFEQIEGAYMQGDTITIRGNVKTYSGAAASYAKISYIVKGKNAIYFRNYNEKTYGTEIICDKNGIFEIPVFLEKNEYIVEVTATDEKGETQTESKHFGADKQSSLFINYFMDDILLKEQLSDIKITTNNRNGKPTAAKATRYEIRNDERTISQGDINGDILPKEIFSKLPSGEYTIQIIATDDRGRENDITRKFHIFSEDDRKAPANTTDFFYPSDTKCKPGESVKIYLGTSEKISLLYRLYDEDKLVESRWININDELRTFNIAYKATYGRQITVQTAFMKNEQLYTHAVTISREDEMPQLKVNLTSFRDKLLPGSNEVWSMNVTENGKPANSELLCTMYDASLDAFNHYNWNFPPYPRQRKYIRISQLESNRNYAVFTHSPFMPKVKSVNELTFDDFISTARFRRFGYGGIMMGNGIAEQKMMMKSAPALAMDESTDVIEEEVTESVSFARTSTDGLIRSDFAETAFFYPHLTPDSNGNISLKFKMPETLTRWKFIGLAHTKEVNANVISQEIVTQKPFSISANVPRFVLFGDSITVTATLSSLMEEAIAGNAYLEILDADQNLLSRQKLDFTVNGIENKTLAWDTKISDKHSSLIFRFIAENDKFSDGEQYEIPVLPDKKVLLETMPFVVKNIGTTNFTFDLFKQNYDKFDHQNFVIEYNNNPVWSAIQAIPYVTPTSENAIANFSAFYTNVLGKQILHSQNFADYIDLLSSDSELQKNDDVKILSLDQTHYWGDAQDESTQRARIKEFFNEENINKNIDSLFNEVLKLQKDNGGFVWFDGMRENRFVTQYICEGLCRLNKVIPLNDKQLNAKIKALGFLQKCFDEEYQTIKKTRPNKDLSVSTAQIYYLYILCNEKAKLDRESEKYIFNQIKRYWTYFNLYDKALSAIVLNHFGEPSEAKEIIKSLRENADKKNFEMFWPKNVRSFYWNEEPIVTQCAIIEAFEAIEPSKDEIEQMKIWLLSQKQTQRWDNDIATINAVNTIISGNNFGTQTDNFKINVGKCTILPDSALNIGYVKKSFDKDSITPDLSDISVEKTNDEYAYGCAYWQYTAEYKNIENTKGEILNISKKLFIEKADENGVHLEEVTNKRQLAIGEKAVVRITVKVDKDMDFVCINDGFASCFEPKMKLSGYHYSNGTGYYQAYKDNAVQYFFDTLRKGTYVFEYTLFVSRAGVYSNGIGEIQCMYSPSFSNHTQAGKITVK